MSKTKLEWDRKTVSEKILTAEYIVQQMTTNIAIYATPLPALVDVSTATLNLRNTYLAARDGGRTFVQAKNDAEVVLKKMMSSLMSYVNSASLGITENILKSGMEVRKESAPTPAPTKVLKVTVKPSDKRNTIDADWDVVEYAVSYRIEQWQEPETPEGIGHWFTVGTSSKSKYTISNLESAKRYTFRIAAMGTNDRMGAFSQEVSTVAT